MTNKPCEDISTMNTRQKIGRWHLVGNMSLLGVYHLTISLMIIFVKNKENANRVRFIAVFSCQIEGQIILLNYPKCWLSLFK